MKTIPITKMITAYEFEELTPYLTYVYTIAQHDTIFVIDSFCGSYYMDQIKAQYPNHKFILINTHYHFDHIWGNYSFKENKIIAHQLCKEMILLHGKQELHEQLDYFKGKQELYLPNHCFDGKLYSIENLQLWHTPGHTIDSISIYDTVSKHLFVGDSLEKPLVQTNLHFLQEHIKSLDFYLSLDFKQIHAGHTLSLDKEDIRKTRDYLLKLKNDTPLTFDDEYIQSIHEMNLHNS